MKECPQCKRVYETELDKPAGDYRNIQNIFPDEPAWKREQLVTGICSQRCWNLYLHGIDSDKVLSRKDVEELNPTTKRMIGPVQRPEAKVVSAPWGKQID